MAINISNRQASPLGVWSTPTEYKVAPAMGGTVQNVEPTMTSRAILDIMAKAGVVTESTYVPQTAPANLTVPVVTGTPTVGQTLTTTNGTWSGNPTPTYTRQWQRSDDGVAGWSDISGATGTTYTVVEGDVGKFLRGVATATNSAGSASANTVATAAVIAAE